MVSSEQEKYMKQRLSLIIENFQNYKSIKDLSNYLGIPASTIQRDMNKQVEIIGMSGLEMYNKVQEWLINSKKFGLSKGGKTSQTMYNYKKDDLGRYNGIE